MNRIATVVSSAVSLLVVGLAGSACSSAASSSEKTGSSRQDILCESTGLHGELGCGEPSPPIHIFPRPKPGPTFTCTSSATCWVWPKTDLGWDPSFPDDKSSDPSFQQEMIDAGCAPELYFTDSDYSGGVPQTNQDSFQLGFVAFCRSVPPGAWAIPALPSDCGCSGDPGGLHPDFVEARCGKTVGIVHHGRVSLRG